MRPTVAIYGIQDRGQYPKPGFTHDHSICRMEAGRITHYLHLERITRKRYDNELHLHLEDIFDQRLIPLDDNADLIFVNSFVGSSFISKNGRIRFDQGPRRSVSAALYPGFAWLQPKNGTGSEPTAYGMDHELAHIGSNLPFHGAFKENSLHIHFDGGASLGNFSAFLYRNGRLHVLEYHWKLSHLSKLFNDNPLAFAILGHRAGAHCAVPGKLMGFATMARARPEIVDWLRKNNCFTDNATAMTRFHEVVKADFDWSGKLGDTRDPFQQELAAGFQRIFEEEWLHYLSDLQTRVQADFLYLSGGCALNIVANSKIVHSGMFQDVYIPPCPGDSGLSIGAAAFAEWQKHGRIERHSPYLNNVDIPQKTFSYDPYVVALLAEEIAVGKVIGLCNGPAEAGPRALGNRSIIARPDSRQIALRVSLECKQREWYRPVAPVLLKRNALRLSGLSAIHHLSRFMLLDYHVPEHNRSDVIGVVHANGTSRFQTLFDRSENPFLFDLLEELDQRFGIPALLNTSFNRREPIVHTPEQARNSAEKMGLDGIVINGKYEPLHSTLIQ